MRITACIVVTCLLAAIKSGMAVADTPLAESEAKFLGRCHEEVLHTSSSADTWVDRHCATKWRRAEKSAPMVEAIFAFLPDNDKALSLESAQARLPMVQWSSDGSDGKLHDLQVHLPEAGHSITFHWQQQGGESPYNIIDALRIRGAKLHILGCPNYPGASMGREKVMMVTSEDGQSTFLLTVYSRPAPTGIEQGLYQVDVDFSGTIPDMADLQAGHYPGGGGRAFATEPTGWLVDCPDPD